MITTQWLSDEITMRLNEDTTTLKGVVVSYTQNSISIDWNYSRNNKYDIYDAQVIVDGIIKKFKGYDTDVSWDLADRRSVITLKKAQRKI